MSTNLKLVIVGDTEVGKTCLLFKSITKKFPDVCMPTMFEEFSTDMIVNDHKCHLNIWDTSGNNYIRSSLSNIMIVFRY